jgi:hypothetical protein
MIARSLDEALASIVEDAQRFMRKERDNTVQPVRLLPVTAHRKPLHGFELCVLGLETAC